jgi:hypothetical protein
MPRRLIETLIDVIEAEREAADLRKTHGLSAEEHCARMVNRAKSDSEREHLKDVRRALRWI